jgi:hypothetical protein
MKPTRSILDSAFKYVPAVATSVASTWRRFGWRPAAETRIAKRGSVRAGAPERRASPPDPAALPFHHGKAALSR